MKRGHAIIRTTIVLTRAQRSGERGQSGGVACPLMARAEA